MDLFQGWTDYLLVFLPGQELTDGGAVPGGEDEGRLAVTSGADPGDGGLVRPPGEHMLRGRGTPETHLAVIVTENKSLER